MTPLHITVASTRQSVPAARATVRSASRVLPRATVVVLDVDGTYQPVAEESVRGPADLGLPPRELHLLAAALPPDGVVARLLPRLVAQVLDGEPASTVLALEPGVLLLSPPDEVIEGAVSAGLCLVAREPEPTPDDGLWPLPADVAAAGRFCTAMVAVHGARLAPGRGAVDAGSADRWLDVLAAGSTHHTIEDAAVLLSPWSLNRGHHIVDAADGLELDGRPVVALDLSSLDPLRPWILRGDVPREPRGRLSDHPALARRVRQAAHEMLADPALTYEGRAGSWDITATSLGTPVDAPLRELYRSAAAAAAPTDHEPPDPFDPALAEDLRTWLTEPVAGPAVGRYLLALWSTRPDLRMAFPRVPGPDAAHLARWAREHATDEGYPADLLNLPAPGTAPPSSPPPRRAPEIRRGLVPGVAVVGYLHGELGIGESARLMVAALQAAGVPHAAVPIDQGLLSRQSSGGGPPTPAASATRFDTSLVCVNADLTPAVAAAVPELFNGRRRIGMWYWEVEEFPRSQHGGFDHVDEVWVATDFVRRAVEPHSPVPVRIVTPPLPQRGAEPTLTRADLGLPDRPLFLFSFDFLSTAERKNPWGLIDAFRQAFAPGEGPVLVIKSINADRRPAEAERLRLHAAGHPDVLLLEEYLEAADRDALMALCDCYVSLHRSEGLGLTMAEAMAWGKPVIATGYSGNLQFMTEENSFLVPWVPVAIPPDAEPYPAGGTWADPDLMAAAAAMRLVVDQPEVAAARGARAAVDIATLHSAEVAGRRVAEQLTEARSRRRRPADERAVVRLRNAAARARQTLKRVSATTRRRGRPSGARSR